MTARLIGPVPGQLATVEVVAPRFICVALRSAPVVAEPLQAVEIAIGIPVTAQERIKTTTATIYQCFVGFF